jgi:Ca2+-binding RTX toxin-like protein
MSIACWLRNAGLIPSHRRRMPHSGPTSSNGAALECLESRQLLTVIQLPVNDHVVLENGPVAGESQLRSLNDTFDPISVPNPQSATDSVDITVNEGTMLLISGLDAGFNGDLTISGNTGSVVRFEGEDIDAGAGAIQVFVGRIEVASSLSADGQIELFTTDLGSPLQDVIIEGGAIQSRTSGISIEASDDLRLDSTASLTAAESIDIRLDSVNNDAVGSHAHLMGAMHAGSGITITGGEGDDVIHAGAQHADLQIHGHGGADVINGGMGNDSIYGGEGRDRVNGRGGHDRIHGGAGNHSLSGGAGNDSLCGEDGDDLLRGQGGHDFINGNAGSDTATGGNGNDSLWGGMDKDDLSGGKGHDQLIAGEDGLDLINGGAGNTDLVTAGGNGFFVASTEVDQVMDDDEEIDDSLTLGWYISQVVAD